MRILIAELGVLAGALSLSLLAPPAGAQPVAAGTPEATACAQAGSMMTATGAAATAADPPADVDKRFVAMATMHERAMMTLMHVEMQCGKNPKVIAAAQKGLADSQSWLDILRMLPARAF